jgi:alkylation response protein AidB-like acyl-CoA dehydrogenase
MRLSEEQNLIRDTMRAFAQGELAPNAARWDRESFPAKSCASWASSARSAWSCLSNGTARRWTTSRLR